MRLSLPFCLLFCVASLLCVAPSLWLLLPVSAQGFSPSPLTPSQPPVVFCQVAFNKISKVDGVEQLFTADFYMQTMWFDLDRQTDWEDAVNNNDGRMPPTNAAGNFQFTPYFEGWYDPLVEFVNAAGEVLESGTYYVMTTPEIISDDYLTKMGQSGNRETLYWMIKDYRYIGDFTTPLDLKAFPFDTQQVNIAMESQFAGSDGLQLYYTDPHHIDNMRLREDQNPIVGWKVKGAHVVRQDHEYDGLSIGGTYSRLTVGLDVEREPDYYVMKICMGVMLLVFMCIWVFALQIDEADRMMGTLQVFAGLITFLFVASADVPKIPYQTRLDIFMNFSFFIVAIILFIHGTLYYWRECDMDEEESQTAKSMAVADGEDKTNVSREPSSKPVHIEMNRMMAPSTNSARASGQAPPIYVNAPDDGSAGIGRAFSAPRPGSGSAVHAREGSLPQQSGSLKEWWSKLVFTRKWDVVCIIVLTITYTVGVAVILGRPKPAPSTALTNEDSLPPF